MATIVKHAIGEHDVVAFTEPIDKDESTGIWPAGTKGADLELHDELLGVAFVGRNDPYRPLAEHIAEIISKSSDA